MPDNSSNGLIDSIYDPLAPGHCWPLASVQARMPIHVSGPLKLKYLEAHMNKENSYLAHVLYSPTLFFLIRLAWRIVPIIAHV